MDKKTEIVTSQTEFDSAQEAIKAVEQHVFFGKPLPRKIKKGDRETFNPKMGWFRKRLFRHAYVSTMSEVKTSRDFSVKAKVRNRAKWWGWLFGFKTFYVYYVHTSYRIWRVLGSDKPCGPAMNEWLTKNAVQSKAAQEYIKRKETHASNLLEGC
jgi:hypothetical protein